MASNLIAHGPQERIAMMANQPAMASNLMGVEQDGSCSPEAPSASLASASTRSTDRKGSDPMIRLTRPGIDGFDRVGRQLLPSPLEIWFPK